MWISRDKYDALMEELNWHRKELAVYQAKELVRAEIAAMAEAAKPKPETETLKPIDRDKTARLNDLLKKGETPWKKYQREAAKKLREKPEEIVVNTPATQ